MLTEALNYNIVEKRIHTPGVLTLLAGPTASGKSTVLEGVLEKYPDMKRIISTTTRPIRKGETDGIDYHFLTRDTFLDKVQQGGFLETVEYENNLYGTQKEDLEPILSGEDRIWIVNMGRAVEIEGFFQKAFSKTDAQVLSNSTVLTLIGAPSLFTLRDRFRRRGSSGDFVARIQEDWDVWKKDSAKFPNIIMNRDGNLEKTVDKVAQLIEERRSQLVTRFAAR